MSRQEHNKDTRLKELLDKAKQQPEDDFEKEALEGFAMLGHEQEAFDLKAALDQRMQEEVLAGKKSTSPGYWFAAAGMLLAVGLSAYFLLMNDPAKKERNNELVITEFKAAPPELPQAEKSAEPALSVPPARPLALAQQKVNRSIQPAGPGAAQNAGASARISQSQQMADSIAFDALASNQEITLPVTVSDENADVDKGRKDDNAAAKTETYNWAATDKKEQAESEEKNEPAKTKSRAKKEKDRKTVAATPAYAYNSAPKEAAAAEENEKSSMGNCYYEGGDAVLYKELSQRLVEKKLDLHFKAKVFVNALGRISKVEFTEKNKLSPEEQNEITYVIQSLDKFRFRQRPSKEELCEYPLAR